MFRKGLDEFMGNMSVNRYWQN